MDITETRWCDHGLRLDTYCAECAIIERDEEIKHMQKVIDRVARIRLDLESENRRLRAALERYERGIRWALGESPEGTPEFPVVTGPPYYRWRTKLREITGIMPREALQEGE